MGDLSNTASDIVGGLRVLRGIGGEQVFHDRYRRESQTTRRAGVAVARLQSVLDALQVLLPGVFVVLVVWLGARYAVAGPITPGELVAFYGYSAFLMIPLRTATEYANKLIRARVAARRVCRVLALDPDRTDPAEPAEPAAARVGAVRRPHRPAGARRAADRRGLRPARRVRRARRPARPVRAGVDDDVRLGGVPLTGAAARRRTPADRGVRHRRDAVLRPARATGSTSTGRGDASTARCDTASADDILEALPDGPGHGGRRARPHASPAASGSGWCWPAR